MPSDINKTLSSISVKVVSSQPKVGATNFRLKRRAVQIAILVLLVLVPVTGLFRIDPENGALVVLGW